MGEARYNQKELTLHGPCFMLRLSHTLTSTYWCLYVSLCAVGVYV